MWLLRIILFISLFGFLESLAGPKNFDGRIYKHVVMVTDVGLEYTSEGEALATVEVNKP